MRAQLRTVIRVAAISAVISPSLSAQTGKPTVIVPPAPPRLGGMVRAPAPPLPASTEIVIPGVRYPYRHGYSHGYANPYYGSGQAIPVCPAPDGSYTYAIGGTCPSYVLPAAPVYAAPAYTAPVYAPPAYGPPAYAPPTYGAPGYPPAQSAAPAAPALAPKRSSAKVVCPPGAFPTGGDPPCMYPASYRDTLVAPPPVPAVKKR